MLSDVLDVAIGLVLAWFLLSLAVSAINEAIAWLTRSRAKVLWRALARLFTDVDLKGKFSSLVLTLPQDADVRAHAGEPGVTSSVNPQLQDFHDRASQRVPDPGFNNGKTRISNIPAEVVADTLQSMAAATVTRASLLAVIDTTAPLRPVVVDRLDDGPPLDEAEAKAEIPPELHADFDAAWAKALRVITVDDLAAVVAGNSALVSRIRTAVVGLTEGEKVRVARAEIERWFNGAMDGAARLYRRQNRKIAAAIALPVVFLASADSFGLISRLREDRDLRAAAATAAAEWASEPLGTTDTGGIDLEKACERITDVGTDDSTDTSEPTDTTASTDSTGPTDTTEPTDSTAATTPTTTTTEPDPIDEARRRYKCAGDLFASSELIGPVGPNALWDEIRAADDSDHLFNDLVSFLFLGSGFWGRLVTWVALLFGASFWYDVLRRLVGLKGKPAASRDG